MSIDKRIKLPPGVEPVIEVMDTGSDAMQTEEIYAAMQLEMDKERERKNSAAFELAAEIDQEFINNFIYGYWERCNADRD